MKKSLGLKTIALPAALLLVGAAVFPACSSKDDAAAGCEGSIKAKVTAFSDAVSTLSDVSASFKADLGIACYKIAKDLGDTTVQDPGDGKSLTDDQLTAMCNAASLKLKAEVQAAGQVTVTVEGGECRVDAQAQVSCEGTCSVNAQCQGGDVSARCKPGELSVSCQGTCQAGAYCEGSAQVDAKCQGVCDATCTGTCSGTCTGTCQGTCSAKDAQGNCVGTCSGTCTGKCSASCNGTCKGNCKLDANANIECGASARCKGTCQGTATAPKCEVVLDPPTCKVDADCQAACKSSASLKAECDPIKVVVVVAGHASLKSTLEANFPAIVRVGRHAKLAADATADVFASGTAVVAEAASSGVSCAASVAGSFKAQVEASVSAVATVNVSVSASASVSGSASGSSS